MRTFRWVKKGRIYTPGERAWSAFYGFPPTPAYLPKENKIRVYFGAADANLFGRVGFLDLDASDPTRIVYEHPTPVLDIGEDGTFDDSGVVPSCYLADGERRLLYTIGFQRSVKTPLMLSAGLAQQEKDGENFFRVSQAPILPRVPHRPFMQGAPCVLKEDGKYRMWHWFVSGWESAAGKQYSRYHIGYAESADGVEWEMQEEACLSPQPNEIGLARPWVVKKNGGYEMWFSVRELTADHLPAYRRIMRATSADGVVWTRDETPCLLPSTQGWDSQMVCYPAVLDAGERRLMFYCGNENGKTGFGLAEWENGVD